MALKKQNPLFATANGGPVKSDSEIGSPVKKKKKLSSKSDEGNQDLKVAKATKRKIAAEDNTVIKKMNVAEPETTNGLKKKVVKKIPSAEKKVKKENKSPASKKPKEEDKQKKTTKKDKKENLNEKIKAKKFTAKKLIAKTTGTGEEEKKTLTKIEMREKQKQLKTERRKKKEGESVFELSVQAKKVWEEVRREDCPKERQGELLDQLLKLVKGQVKKLVLAHDTSRVIECLVSLGDPKIRDSLYDELKDDLTLLMKSRYASFFVQKLVKYGNKEQKAKVFKVLEGQVARLARHKVANAVLELCYNDFSNGVQRNHFIQEFFGPEFIHFKDDTCKNVLDVIAKRPEKAKSILKSLQENSNILLTKGCYNISLVHTVLYNYMLVLNSQTGAEVDKLRSEFVAQLRDVCVHLLHSHDGARLSMHALWLGTAKDRKSIIKSFKGHVTKIASEEQGHLVLMALFDCVDDTKLVGKAILGELSQNLTDVMSNKHGRDVIVYLMAPRSTMYFYPGTLDILKQGDGNTNSKKDTEIRRKELYECAAPIVLKHLQEHLTDFINESGPSIIMIQVILKTSALLAHEGGNEEISNLFKSIFSKLGEETAKPFVSGEDPQNLVENAATHRLLRKVITQDKENKIVAGAVLFSVHLTEALDNDSIDSYLDCNRGCFILVNLLETEIESVVSKLLELLKPHEAKLKKKMIPGAEVLRKKLLEIQNKK